MTESKIYTNREITVDESGVVIALLAIMSLLLVILAVGYAIDFPTTQASVSRTQSGLDIGATHGLYTYWDVPAAANSAFANADAVLRNQYASKKYGVFASGFDVWNQNKHTIWIPKYGSSNGAGLNDYFTAFSGFVCQSGTQDSCVTPFTVSDLNINESTSIDERVRTVLSSVFDQGTGGEQIDDFKNAVMFYTHVRPFRYLSFLPEAETEVVSIPRLKNVMTYVVVDPAFSMGDGNYERMFGSAPTMNNGNNDPMMWPFAAFRKAVGQDIVYPLSSNGDAESVFVNTNWPDVDNSQYVGAFAPGAWAGTLKRNPVTGNRYKCDAADCPDDDSRIEQVFKYYAALCDTMPFFHFKAGVVNFLDRLTSSSAYNSTTIVTLTGYGVTGDMRLVPVFPAEVGAGTTNIVSSPRTNYYFEPTAMPLPVFAGEDHNRYLHMPRPKTFTGYLDSGNADSNCTGSCPSSGFNRWELAYCRALYSGSSEPELVPGMWPPTTGFALPEDRTNVPAGSDAVLSHGADGSDAHKRFRSNQFKNWVDDQYVDPDLTDGVNLHDYDIVLGYSRDGASPDENGETPRNIIGNLAIRTNEMNIETDIGANFVGVSPWLPPSSATTTTGFRYLPTSIRKACEDLTIAVNDYAGSGTIYSKLRPVQEDAVAVFAFGIWNQSGLQAKNASGDAAFAGASSTWPTAALAEFDDVLNYCLCGKPDRKIYLSFLPMDTEDRSQVLSVLNNIISVYAAAKMQMCSGQVPSNDPCGGQEMGSIFTFLYDYGDYQRFGYLPGTNTKTEDVGPITGSGSASDIGLRKLIAAEAFNREVFEIITKLMISYAYAT